MEREAIAGSGGQTQPNIMRQDHPTYEPKIMNWDNISKEGIIKLSNKLISIDINTKKNGDAETRT